MRPDRYGVEKFGALWPEGGYTDLPDSRLRSNDRAKGSVFGPGGEYVRVFCANCGRAGGLARNLAMIHYLCQPCADKCGTDEALGLRQIPDEIMRPPEPGREG